MNPYLIKNPLHQLFHFVQLAGNFFSRNVVIAFPDMTDIGLTFVDQFLAFIRYFVFFLFLFYDFFLFVIFQTCAAVVLISLIGKQEVIVLRIHMCFVKKPLIDHVLQILCDKRHRFVCAVCQLLDWNAEAMINLAYIASITVQQTNFFCAPGTKVKTTGCKYTENDKRNQKHMGNGCTECYK